jgi:hypothetical protein
MKTQRRSNQEGSLYEDHGAWYVRYREHGARTRLHTGWPVLGITPRGVR